MADTTHESSEAGPYPSHDQSAGAFFSNAHHFSFVGGTFKSITNFNQGTFAEPSKRQKKAKRNKKTEKGNTPALPDDEAGDEAVTTGNRAPPRGDEGSEGAPDNDNLASPLEDEGDPIEPGKNNSATKGNRAPPPKPSKKTKAMTRTDALNEAASVGKRGRDDDEDGRTLKRSRVSGSEPAAAEGSRHPQRIRKARQ
ncbi:hypothetical protein FB451DRAFT_1292095 [Mycena latifolia]|nr:hypothetical protein FB451DRAFT_1292095 [Mycena latifolia]